ncbi:MAG TPA: hypothetical protein VLC49_09040 [Solirubrobacteraceae bacterium]|nr:hypothetical protein [Solirubrobacteraceae bacterium]
MRSSNPPSAETSPSPRARETGSLREPLTVALLALTFTSGVVDAASYLGLGRVFTANMISQRPCMSTRARRHETW